MDAKEKLQDINDFIENPEGNIKGRGFNEGLDFFKAGVKGNKEEEKLLLKTSEDLIRNY